MRSISDIEHDKFFAERAHIEIVSLAEKIFVVAAARCTSDEGASCAIRCLGLAAEFVSAKNGRYQCEVMPLEKELKSHPKY